jgi:DNA-binding transcriptional LysR family regulator
MLNLYKLEVFDAVVRAGSFSAAADRLLMTQPAVSQHIHDLEAALGTQLFVRGHRGVTLTEAGETLHRYTQQIVDLVGAAEEAVTDVRNLAGGQVNVGATPGVGIYLLPEWVQEFRATYPHLSVTLRTGITSEILAELNRGTLDLGLIEGELDLPGEGDLRAVELREDEQFVVIGPKHPWWDRSQVRVEELEEQTFIVRQRNSQSRIWLEETLLQYGVRPRIMAEFDAVESIKRAVAVGSCLTVLPAYVVRSDVEMGSLRALPVVGEPLQRTLKLVWDSSVRRSAVVRSFLRSLSRTLPAVEEAID